MAIPEIRRRTEKAKKRQKEKRQEIKGKDCAHGSSRQHRLSLTPRVVGSP
jgi:hypothetical protein